MSAQIDNLKSSIESEQEKITKLKQEIKDFKELKNKEIDSIKNKINSKDQTIQRLS